MVPPSQTVLNLFFFFLWSLSFSFQATHCPQPFYLWDSQLWQVSMFLFLAPGSCWVLTSWKQSLTLPYSLTCCIWKLVVTQLQWQKGLLVNGLLPGLPLQPHSSYSAPQLPGQRVCIVSFFGGSCGCILNIASIAIHWLFLSCSDPKGKEIKCNCVDPGFSAFILQKAFKKSHAYGREEPSQKRIACCIVNIDRYAADICPTPFFCSLSLPLFILLSQQPALFLLSSIWQLSQ